MNSYDAVIKLISDPNLDLNKFNAYMESVLKKSSVKVKNQLSRIDGYCFMSNFHLINYLINLNNGKDDQEIELNNNYELLQFSNKLIEWILELGALHFFKKDIVQKIKNESLKINVIEGIEEVDKDDIIDSLPFRFDETYSNLYELYDHNTENQILNKIHKKENLSPKEKQKEIEDLINNPLLDLQKLNNYVSSEILKLDLRLRHHISKIPNIWDKSAQDFLILISYGFDFVKLSGIKDSSVNKLNSFASELIDKIINFKNEFLLNIEENISSKINYTDLYSYGKNRTEQIEYILESSKKTLKASDILAEMKKLSSKNKNTNENSIKSILLSARSNEGEKIFYYDHRDKSFGLAKWGKFENFYYYSSRRHIVYDFLLKFDEPVSISKIIDHVRKYKETKSESSLLQNLKLQGAEFRDTKYDIDVINNDDNNDFIFFPNNLVGLKNLKYKL